MNNSLHFEIFTILFMLALGSALLLFNLPGWGLIAVAAVLSCLSFGLRKSAVLQKISETS